MTRWGVRDAKPRTAWSEWEGSEPHRVRGEYLNPHEFLKSPHRERRLKETLNDRPRSS